MTLIASDDYAYQAAFVADNAWRLLSMQDADALSPSHGCFHYAYWRDKTSEFADARFQEAGATLGLLTHPHFDPARAVGRLAPVERLYDGFAAALGALARQQYPEGCYDEWYKGERGFAATEFTTIAYGLAARFMGERLRPAERAVLAEVMTKAGGWLARRHDRVKANHEASAAAALALAWEVTGNAGFKAAARAAVDDTLARQQSEGWFPEIGGMDLGYCSVLLDYLMIHATVTGDGEAIPAMRRLFAFMRPHIHPDGTIGPESGLCLNPYVSRLGLGLLATWDEDAAALLTRLRTASPGPKGLTPYLADDLRLCRWSHLAATAVLMTARPDRVPALSFEQRYPQGWTIRRDSLVAAFHRDDLHVYFAPAGGGAVRVYRGATLVAEDIGVSLRDASGHWGSVGYDTDRPLEEQDGGLEMRSALRPAAFFYPSFLARLILRLGSSFAWSSYLMRALIDAYRLRARTAINQSAAPVTKGRETYGFSRRVEIIDNAVIVRDRLHSRGSAIAPAGLVLTPPPSGPMDTTLVMPAKAVEIRKIFNADGTSAVTIGPMIVEE